MTEPAQIANGAIPGYLDLKEADFSAHAPLPAALADALAPLRCVDGAMAWSLKVCALASVKHRADAVMTTSRASCRQTRRTNRKHKQALTRREG